ncbi:hypothetical protein HK097_004077, partial [Rhizophlyctis rosea]
MEGYRIRYIDDIKFYTNRGSAVEVKNNLKRFVGPNQYMIAIYDTYVHKKGHLNPCIHFGLLTSDQLHPLLLKDHRFCEVLTRGNPFYRVFFDIDFKGKNVKDPLELVKEKISSILPNAQFNVSGSHKVYEDGTEKYSYYIIVDNYHAEDLDDFAPIKAFCLNNKIHGFDESVYRNDGLLKCINQSKGACRVQRLISGSEDLLQHTVMHENLGESVHINTVPTVQACVKEAAIKRKRKAVDSPVTKNAKKIKLLDVQFPKMNLQTPPELDIYSDPPATLLRFLPNYSRGHHFQLSHIICTCIARWCKYVSLKWEDFWEWNKQKDASPEREAKYIRYWATMNLNLHPVTSKLVSSYLSIFVHDKEVLKTHPVRQMIASYNTHFDHQTEMRHIGTDDHVKAKNNKHVIMHVPLGGAKSHSTMTWLRDHIKQNPEATVLWLTCRIALAKDQCGRIEKLTDCYNWKYYDKLSRREKKDSERIQEQYFVCSIQSLHYARGLYDVVVIDECETLLKSFDPENKCVKNMELTWGLFQVLLRDAKKVVYLDGFITQITKGLLDDMKQPFYIAGSSRPPPPRQMIVCDTSTYIYDQIQKSIDNGEKVFVATGAKGEKSPSRQDSVEHIVSTILKNNPGWKYGREVVAYHGGTQAAKKALENGTVN